MSALTKQLHHVFSLPQTLANKLVDNIGMYRVVTLSLLLLVAISIIAGATGLLYYSPLAQAVSLLVALGIALTVNILCARVWRVHANHESAVITALILFFMMIPSASLTDNWQLAAGVALAMLSKYVLAWRRQHILNPAAVGAVTLVLIVAATNIVQGSNYNTDIFSWWVANPILLWPVLLLGLIIVSKVRRMAMLMTFITVGLAVFIVDSMQYDPSVWNAVKLYFVSYPTLFLGFFMLTEPFTTPPRGHQQMIYGGLVGALASTSVFSPWFSMTPELALVLGNLFAYSFRIKQKVLLTYQSKRQLATNTWEFSFVKPAGFTFQAGQYAEWMLPHTAPDNRGIRRYFTIASSPSDTQVRVAFNVMPAEAASVGSSFKRAFLALDNSTPVILSQVAGDFLLPAIARDKPAAKIGMIAGGIGMTPFISQLRTIHAHQQLCDVSLYHCVNTADQLIYQDEFAMFAQQIDLRVTAVISKEKVSTPYHHGYVTAALLAQCTPDFKERIWYLSGPPAMVNSYKNLLLSVGVSNRQIKTDYFPGLA